MRAEQRKLQVKWRSDIGLFFCTHPNTNVTGQGQSPGAAIRDWQYWWNIPY